MSIELSGVDVRTGEMEVLNSKLAQFAEWAGVAFCQHECPLPEGVRACADRHGPNICEGPAKTVVVEVASRMRGIVAHPRTTDICPAYQEPKTGWVSYSGLE